MIRGALGYVKVRPKLRPRGGIDGWNHRQSSKILVVWDRESPRSEIKPWWIKISNFFWGSIFFFFFGVYVLSQIRVCVCDSMNLCLWICVWKGNFFFFLRLHCHGCPKVAVEARGAQRDPMGWVQGLKERPIC